MSRAVLALTLTLSHLRTKVQVNQSSSTFFFPSLDPSTAIFVSTHPTSSLCPISPYFTSPSPPTNLSHLSRSQRPLPSSSQSPVILLASQLHKSIAIETSTRFDPAIRLPPLTLGLGPPTSTTTDPALTCLEVICTPASVLPTATACASVPRTLDQRHSACSALHHTHTTPWRYIGHLSSPTRTTSPEPLLANPSPWFEESSLRLPVPNRTHTRMITTWSSQHPTSAFLDGSAVPQRLLTLRVRTSSSSPLAALHDNLLWNAPHRRRDDLAVSLRTQHCHPSFHHQTHHPSLNGPYSNNVALYSTIHLFNATLTTFLLLPLLYRALSTDTISTIQAISFHFCFCFPPRVLYIAFCHLRTFLPTTFRLQAPTPSAATCSSPVTLYTTGKLFIVDSKNARQHHHSSST
ncbi:hypothetical protein FJTKL_01884 [Diaporthe vaccinii]|uniref:Uncharacterized protein n=1 Tax=Diaporthe vaccinii TaxID=105482 RepID=A0ABR4F4Q5_9PEZI